jgi:5-methylcytosine-specific restriction endonuclease McrA
MPKRVWTADEKRIVAARNEWKCGQCKKLLNAAYEIDHIRALEEGGSNDLTSNAQALCSNCHGIKTQKERVERIKRARAKLKSLQENESENTHDKQPTRTEDVILDPENPFAKFCFLP